MNIFHTLYHLVSEHQDRLQGEPSITLTEQFLKTAAQFIHDHAVPVLMLAEPVDLRNTNAIS